MEPEVKQINSEAQTGPASAAMCQGVWDTDFNCIVADESVFRFLKCFKQNPLIGYIDEGDRERFAEWWNTITTETSEIITKIQKSDGEIRDVLIKARVIAKNGERQHISVTITDILAASEDYSGVYEDLGNVTAYLEHLEGCEFEYNCESNTLELFKYVENKRVPVSNQELLAIVPELSEIFARTKGKPEFIHEIIQGKGNESFSVDGACIYEEYDMKRVFGRIRKNNQRADDIQDQTPIENIDTFTGLWNKVGSLEYLRQAIEDKNVHQVVVFMMDIDSFKLFNDTYGHAFGDEVIMRMAQILKSVVKGRGIAARFGGDEFMMVLKDLGPESAIRTVAESIRTQMSWAFTDKLNGGKISCTIGIAETPRNGTDFDTIFNKSDRALYIGKQKGKNRYIIYKEHIHGELPTDEGISLEQGIRDSLKVDEMIDEVANALGLLGKHGKDAFGDVAAMLIRLFRVDRVSIYSGENLDLYGYYGTEAEPVKNLAVMKNPEREKELVNQSGICHTLFNHMQSLFFEDFHGELQKNGVKETTIVRIGTPGNIKGLVAFERLSLDISDSRRWSDEELHILTLCAKMLGTLL
ncbi:MAG: diguanylate cyclase [Lachnospiraceae bacterium]|nr:diguanylate cyclase [Lachnospiraceae bacterium]